MMSQEADNLALVRRYLAAIENGATGATLAAFFDPDVEQLEFPNRLVAQGAHRHLGEILEGAERGQRVLQRQHYEIRSEMASGNRVALEVLWTGILAIAVGAIPVGGVMRAHFGVFFELRNGKILRQHNYDCFEPF